MKKFFKALALVLALTLIFGTIPASAAVNPDNVRKEKTLYVNGTKGKTADGVESKLQARTTYWKLLKIKKAEAKKLGITATSAAPEIIKTNDETMGVRAYAIGGTKDKPIVITLSDGTNLYKVNMVAKKSAETVAFGRDFVDAEKEFSVNTTYELSLPRSLNGVKLDTDERRLIVKDADGNEAAADVVEVKEDATAPRLWTVKFLKAGKYTLVGEAFQSKKYNGTTASYEMTIEVKTPELDDIKQTAVNAFQLSFNGDASAIDFKPQEIYYVVADSVVPFSLLKEVKVNADDPTKVDVTMYGNFKGGTEYFVKVGDVVKSFVACGTDAKDIVDLVITTTSVEYGEFRDIEYKYLNKDGIDITKANDTLKPSFELVSNNPEEVIVSATTIYFHEKDKTATIKGSVTTDWGSEATNYQPVVIPSNEATIVSTDHVSAKFTGMVWSFEGDGSAAKVAKDAKNIHDYAIDDDVVLNIWFKYEKDGNTTYATLAEEKVSRVEVSDENFGVVTGVNEALSFVKIKGIKAVDNMPVILYKKNAEGKDEAFQTVNINIKPARKVSSVILSASKTNLNLETTGGFEDEVKLTLKVTDQYGDGVKSTKSGAITTSQSDVTKTNVGLVDLTKVVWTEGDPGVYTASVTAGAFTWASGFTKETDPAKIAAAYAAGGSVVLSAKVSNVASNNIGIAVADKSSVTAISYIPTLSSATLDIAVKEDNDLSSSTFSVTMSKAGFAAGTLAPTFLKADDFKDADKFKTGGALNGAAAGSFYYTVTLDGTQLNNREINNATADAEKAASFTGNTIKAVFASGNASGSAIQIKKGTYVFTLYTVAGTGDDRYLSNAGSKTLVVSDSQIIPTYTVAKDTSTIVGVEGNVPGNVALAKDVLNVAWNGNSEYDKNIVLANVVKSLNNSDYINTITVAIANTKGLGTLYVEVPVGKLFNGSNK
ncbi:MAG: hypothetical protein K6G45_09580 [Lachnospiraceae bacterium]|nr:hypothetical protein [Lachnospiraceae bacterium]